jgi:ABC-2 type transport system permease protein
MKLKIFLFNKSIIKSDFKRFWWVSALYTLILFFTLPFQHMMLLALPTKEDWQKDVLLSSLHLTTGSLHVYSPGYNTDLIYIQTILICTIPVFLAAMLFSYLHSSRAATVLHSLPLKRVTLLGSHTASGILLLTIPVLVTAVILAVLSLFTGMGDYYTLVNVVEWIGLTMLFNVLFFSITVFVGMLTGNAIAHVIFSYIINILPGGLYILVVYNLEKLFYGFSANSLSDGWINALPLIKVNGYGLRGFTPVDGLLYLLLASAFFAAAGLVYNGRKLEAAGNMVALKIIQPIFKYGFASCLLLSGGLITGYFLHSGRAAVIAVCLVLAFTGCWISQMLLEKSMRVWHAYRSFLIFSAVVALLLAGISADVTGFVKYIPPMAEIESVYYGNNFGSWQREKNKLPEELYFRSEGLFKEEANIKTVMSLHRILIENKNITINTGREEYVAYILKNGKSIVRKYIVEQSQAKKFLVPIYESQEYKEDKYPVLSQNLQDLKLIEIGDRRTSKKPLILSDSNQLHSFMIAMQTELIDADFEEITEPDDDYAYIRTTDRNDRTYYYILRNSYDSLFSWLRDNGYYGSAMLVPGDIDHVTVQTMEIMGGGGNQAYSLSKIGGSADLNDQVLIKELIDTCHSDRNNYNNLKTFLKLDFYSQVKAVSPDFTAYVYSRDTMSKALLQKLKELGVNFGEAIK